MSMKKRILIITCGLVVFIAVLLIFSPILRATPIDIEVGETYRATITLDDPVDPLDEKYRRHTYSLSTLVNEVYSISLSSLSGSSVLLFEKRGDSKTPLLTGGGSGTTEYEINAAGQKIFYIEAKADECPAEYSLRISKTRES